MKLQSIALTAMVTIIVACGTQRPNPDDYVNRGTTEPVKATGNKTAGTTKTGEIKDSTTPPTEQTPATATPPAATPPAATPPAATPPAAAVPRIVATPAEIATAQTLYNGSCMGCHGAVGAASTLNSRDGKLFVAAQNIPPHAAIKANFPLDKTTAPEVLAATAIVALFK